MFDDDVELFDECCPECGGLMYSRECTACHCDEGYIDCYEDDPINYSPGEEYEKCGECNGHGRLIWCGSCGHDYFVEAHNNAHEAELRDACQFQLGCMS